jgi:hypothetical protein
MLKFSLALVAVAIPVSITVAVWNGLETIRTCTAQIQNGAHQLSVGYSAINERRIPEARIAFAAAVKEIGAARSTIQHAQTSFFRLGSWMPWVAPRLTAASHVTDAAYRIAETSGTIASELPTSGKWDSFSVSTDGVVMGSFGALQPLSRTPATLDRISSTLLAAYSDMRAIPESLIPKKYRVQLDPIISIVPTLLGTPEQASDVVTILRDLLGSPDEREYLILFQNDDEARPTGGFPGSYLLVKFDRGTFTITDSPGNGPYALKDHVGKGLLPPQPMLAVSPYWAFQDAAWYADVPTSASSVLDFYEQARGFRPDGVFFITPHLIERLLAITGPITLTDKQKTEVDATTFVRFIEEEVEFKYDKTLNAPKSVLLNVVPELLNRLLRLDAGKGIIALTTFLDEFQRGNMTFVSEVPAVASASNDLRWNGALGDDRAHTLSLIRTNLGGGKTDRAISETDTIRYEPNGTEWNVSVTIAREHFGDPKDKLHGPTNRSFLRLYTDPRARFISLQGASTPEKILQIPAKGAVVSTKLQQAEGSVLQDDATGLRITHESGYTVFGFWSLLPPGQQQSITLRYAIPRDPEGDLKLWLRKQPGETQAKWVMEVKDSTLQPLASAIGWNWKQGVWTWNGLSVYSETVFLKKAKVSQK